MRHTRVEEFGLAVSHPGTRVSDQIFGKSEVLIGKGVLYFLGTLCQSFVRLGACNTSVGLLKI